MAQGYVKNRKTGKVGDSKDRAKLKRKFPGVFSDITKAQYDKAKAKENKGHDKNVVAIQSVSPEAQEVIDRENYEALKLKDKRSKSEEKRYQALEEKFGGGNAPD